MLLKIKWLISGHTSLKIVVFQSLQLYNPKEVTFGIFSYMERIKIKNLINFISFEDNTETDGLQQEPRQKTVQICFRQMSAYMKSEIGNPGLFLKNEHSEVTKYQN